VGAHLIVGCVIGSQQGAYQANKAVRTISQKILNLKGIDWGLFPITEGKEKLSPRAAQLYT